MASLHWSARTIFKSHQKFSCAEWVTSQQCNRLLNSLNNTRRLGSFQNSSSIIKTSLPGYYSSVNNNVGGSRNFSMEAKPLQQQNKQTKKIKKKGEAASTTAKLPDIEGMNRDFKQFKNDIGCDLRSTAIEGPAQYTYRSHTCGELTAKNVGERVTLCGWVTFKRMNGSFIVLRDLYGMTQLYVPKELEKEFKKAEMAPLESVLQITGQVVLRPEKQQRSDQVSGEIEVTVKEIAVLNLPQEIRFAYNDLEKVDEELGIQYRYLYLRNAKVQSILRKRSAFLSSIKRFMDAKHFIELETPTLIRRTPGGAREFPVLSKFKDSYYALAQSPQLLKQLLMAGGLDKYYQIARCYRDETGRPDRQPEFTQLDIELSFTTRANVMQLVEDLLKFSCPPNIIPDKTQPFPKLTYKECMEKYGSDKPNTGGFLWVTDFPLFLRNPQSGKLEAAHHPFTMPLNVDDVYKNPENAIGQSYDLVYCGAEVGGGSIRIHDATLQKYVFQNVLHLPLADIDYLVEALQSGCPPHGGFALGVDRFLSKMFDTKSIRDVIAFPKSSEGRDLLSGAPSPLDKDSAQYYGVLPKK